MEKICLTCQNTFIDKSKRGYQKLCRQCSIIKRRQRDLTKNKIKYSNRSDVIRCEICGFASENDLIPHITVTHNIKIEEYYLKYNLTSNDVRSEKYQTSASNRMKGKLNVAYDHQGKFSPMSLKYLNYEHLSSDNIRLKIEQVKMKNSNSHKNNGNNSTTLLYWINQGYNEEDARLKLSERQCTFSKDKCILKYGQIKGLEIWKNRQIKWINSMSFNNYSQISQELFWHIYNKLPKFIQKECHFAELNTEYKKYSPFTLDFFVSRLNYCIEFQGDYWHANPKLYNKTDMIGKKYAHEIWEKDAIKKQILIDENVIFYDVWEKDFNETKDSIIDFHVNEIIKMWSQSF